MVKRLIYRLIVWSLHRFFRHDPLYCRFNWFGSPNAYITDWDLYRLLVWSDSEGKKK